MEKEVTIFFPSSGSMVKRKQPCGNICRQSIKQHLQYIPNGTYSLTAMVKSSGGQTEAAMRVLNQSSTEIARVDIPMTSTWQQITINNINITDNGTWIACSSSDSVGGKYVLIDDVVFKAQTAISDTTYYECENLDKSTSGSTTNYSDLAASEGAFNNLNASAVMEKEFQQVYLLYGIIH
jgi:hypothetical protein